ncbi:DExH-box splicing factor binding site-domain-containing protein [Hypoxylon fragiforme]|uniref:DExH-box splicing factor binding site-domain-containing protein n=1 Tax=Hypoxylon fragiforme TaxID=63214 RepID=UPI0020C6B457|nr:DExH-box splicing factor binding site-domain-containing protein [Hypoxylon fragiforme]KAI2613164.1 DExH-box splicing factor binding site-domain-containing protein [Hypoxylon fragiforme]
MTEPAPRIAIKFGTSSSSSKPTNGAKKHQALPHPPSTLGKRVRPRHALNNDSDSGSDDETQNGKHQVVTTIGEDWIGSDAKRRSVKTDKATGAKTPYVITGHTNRDWKAELKGKKVVKDGSPHRKGTPSHDFVETEPADKDKQVKWGLMVTKKTTQANTEETDEIRLNEQQSTSIETATNPEDSKHDGPQNRDIEEGDAMDALLGKKRKSAKELVIEDTSKRNMSVAQSEQDAYRRRMEEAANVSTIEEYDQIPEGEFGAAMLRGMGWNGVEHGSKPKEVKKRSHLMGLGSKEDEEIKKGELARKNGHRERKPRLNEYRREKDKERRDRDERRGDSYKSERERERQSHSHSHSHRDRDRNNHRLPERSHRH